MLLYAALYLLPGVLAFRVSLFQWSSLSSTPDEFVGMANFVEAFRDPWLRVAFRNTIAIGALGGVIVFVLSLTFAVVLTRARTKAKTLFRLIIFLPYLLPVVGVAIMWKFALNPNLGLVNQVLRRVGLGSLALPWLGSTATAVGSIGFVTVWVSVGFFVLLFISAIGSIPPDLSDAARVDGANEWQIFRYVTLPLLREVLATAAILWGIWALRLFGVPFAMTRGNPARSTHTIATYLIDNAFPHIASGSRLGYSSAIAVMLLVMVLGLSLVYYRLRGREAIEF
jgi:ABC-type sugar transport system permease subunit